jgi:surface antigen
MRKPKGKPRSPKRIQKPKRTKSAPGRFFLQLAFLAILVFGVVKLTGYVSGKKFNPIEAAIGKPVDQLNGVFVYYNGSTGNSSGRNIAPCGYNIGQKYQCVEFVKRYYFEHLGHKMPNSFGHARDYFNKNLDDGQLNRDRNLLQFTNPGSSKPKVDDIVVFRPTALNPYGHVAVVSRVNRRSMEIIHQNAGPGRPTRLKYDLKYRDGKWEMDSERAMGWLRVRD